MQLHYCSDYEEMSRSSAITILNSLRKQPKQLLCASTGNSPKKVYKELAKQYQIEPQLFDKLSIIKLDEWGGLPASDPNSCEFYIQEHMNKPLRISENRFISFHNHSKNPREECDRIHKELLAKGPIDLCILGLGKNGHLGFNEPAEQLEPHSHIAVLTKESLQHQMIHTRLKKPSFGLTLGMADILQSKHIVFLITGQDKKDTIRKFLTKKITSYLPASFLWLHPNTECYIDKEAL